MAYILNKRSHTIKEDKRNLDQVLGTDDTRAYGIVKDIFDLMVSEREADDFNLRCGMNDVDLSYLHATSGYLVDGVFRGVTFDEAVVSSEKVLHYAQDLDEWKKVVYELIFKALFKVADHRFILRTHKVGAKVTVANKCFDLTVKRGRKGSFSFSSIDTIGFPDSIVSELVLLSGYKVDVKIRLKKWLLSEYGARVSKGSEKFMIEHLVIPSYLLIDSSNLGDSVKPNRSVLELELWYKMF